MKKILWFSRHQMTDEQKKVLGDAEITNINGSIQNVHIPFQGDINGEEQEIKPFKELIQDFDIIAIVLPINLQQQVLGIAGDKPVIQAKNQRIIEKVDGQEDKVLFKFDGWFQIKKIEVVLEKFSI